MATNDRAPTTCGGSLPPPSDRRPRFSQDDYRQLLDAAPDALVVVDENACIAFANAQTEKLFGYSADELVGRPLEILIPERFRLVHRGHLQRYTASPSTRSMGSGIDLYGRRKDGAEVPVEVSLSPARSSFGPSVCAAIRDITERKRIEAAAKLSAERLAGAVETSQDAFAIFDADDKLVLCNSVYRCLLGAASIDSLMGKSYEEVLDAWIPGLMFDSDEQRLQFRAERLASRREPSASFEVRTRDGRSLRVSDRRAADGGVVKTIWDLTDDVRLARELREARAAAEDASKAKSEFLSSMSHELRTPLNAILGFAQILVRDRKEPLSNRHKERVAQILQGGEHLLHLIDDILDLSRIEAGRLSISVEPVSVAEVLEQVVTTIQPHAAHSDVRLQVVPPLPSIPPANADRTRLMQILMNFGSNAIKYNRAGGNVTFTAAAADPGRVRVVVADTGFGIPADQQHKMFQPFQRAGQEAGPIEGTGIGLVISKRLAELMGGGVGFTSTPGAGSEFWVELPAHVTETGMAPIAADPSREASLGARSASRLILYVEDNPASVSVMRDVLGDFEHFELVTTPTAEMGIELAIARKPHLIILDINLPGMSGFEALQRLRSRPETKTTPVIALSAAASARDKDRGLEAGFYRYLTKPVKLDELLEALEGVLKH